MKAQAAAIDLVLATVLFTLLSLAMISLLTSELKNQDLFSDVGKRDRLAAAAATQLAFTQGRPENCNGTDCDRLGLSCAQGTLCGGRASNLQSLYSSDYNATRRMLNLDAYDISIFICSPANYTDCDYNITTPARDANRSASSQVSRAEALSTLGGKTVSVILFAWD